MIDDGSGDMVLRNLRINPVYWTEADGNVSLQFFYVAAEGNFVEKDYIVRFVDGEGNEYDIDASMPSGAAYTTGTTFVASEYSDFVTKAKAGESFSVYIIYKDSEDNDVVVQCYTLFSFSIA